MSVGRFPLPPDKQRKANRRHYRQGDDDRIRKPVISLAATEHDLERYEPSDQKGQTDDIEVGLGLWCLDVWQERNQQDHRCQREWHVEKKDVSPAIPLSEITADGRVRHILAPTTTHNANGNCCTEASLAGIREIDGGLRHERESFRPQTPSHKAE